MLSQASLDGIAIHLYPIEPKQLDVLSEAGRIARKAGKPIFLDETWLCKIGLEENERIARSEKVFKRNYWRFFTPLDQRFLRAVDAFARAEGVSYASPFWSHLYYATLPYDADLHAEPYQTADATYLQGVMAAILSGRHSPLGETVTALLAGLTSR